MRPLLILALLAGTMRARAAPPVLKLGLDEAERAAMGHSPILKAAESNLSAAEAQVDVQLSQLLPRLTADGNYQYQTEIPNVPTLPPGIVFASHRSYSAGPTLTYTLWDQGSLWKAWHSQKALARSESSQRELVARQVKLMTRLDYFQVQVSLEQQRSLLDSLRLAGAQYRDINKRFRAGAASRIDWLSAHEQVLGRRRDLRSAEASVAASLRALFAQTGQGQAVDLAVPMDARIEQPFPEGVDAPTVRVELEPLDQLERKFETAATAPEDPSYPQLQVYSEQAESQRLTAQSISAGQWPRVSLSARSYYFYPNLPLPESAWQNSVQLTASIPLFEFGRTRKQAQAQRDLADASDRQRDEAFDELDRDWHKARDQFAALHDESAIDRQSVAETEEIAKLRYASYRDGGSTILDVETANLNAVQARITAAQTLTQMLIQLATLESLSKVNP